MVEIYCCYSEKEKKIYLCKPCENAYKIVDELSLIQTQFLLDYLNKDYYSLADIKDIDNITEDDREYIELVKNEVLSINYEDVKEFVDTVMLNTRGKKDFDKINAKDKEGFDNVAIDKKNVFNTLTKYYIYVMRKNANIDILKYSAKVESHRLIFNSYHDGDFLINDLFTFNTMGDFLLFLICKMLKENVYLRKCLICEKYFIPSRSDKVCCNSSSPKNKNVSCNEYYNYIKNRHKIKTEEIERLINKIRPKLRRRLDTAKKAKDNYIHDSNCENNKEYKTEQERRKKRYDKRFSDYNDFNEKIKTREERTKMEGDDLEILLKTLKKYDEDLIYKKSKN